MKLFNLLFALLIGVFTVAQEIRSIQVFNPRTNDETPVITQGEQLVLKFDDLANTSQLYRYTFKHYNRNWEEDGLFFTEFASGSMNALIENFQFSFNTYQKYTNYELKFPNDKIQLKISGNYEIIVYKDSQDKPLFTRRFCIYENGANLGINVTRFIDAKYPNLKQRVEVQATGNGSGISNNLTSLTLNVIQNNNWDIALKNLRASSTMGNQLLFQQLNLAFPGNNEFYYFDNKVINEAMDMVSNTENIDGRNYTYLYPVWAYPGDYQYQPDVNGAFYFRRNDLGIERNPDREADYSWVYFALDSQKSDKEFYVLGLFNDYQADKTSQMVYDDKAQKYIAKIYLKQGFYSYVIATKDSAGKLNFGEVNGNFWQTENLYQAFLYYTPFGRNFDGLIGYGEFRTPVR